MKTFTVVSITLVLVLLVGIFPVNAATLSNSTANHPWKTQLFKGGEAGVKNLSTAFVGKFQTPMLSYSKVGSHIIYRAFKATSAFTGNCGPNNSWYCDQWSDSSLVPGTVSEMATMQIIDTHLIQWAYSTTTTIRGVTIERMNNMSFVTQHVQDLIQLNKFGGILVGTPSLQTSGGHYRLAVTIRSGGDFPTYTLVYMYYIGNFNNSSCMTGGFAYQCDVIEESSSPIIIGSPSMQLAPDGTVGMAYFKSGEGLKYAYPHTHTLFYPSNCGPGSPQTWRCISIFSGTATGTLGNVVKFAFGTTSFDRGIAFTYDDVLIDNTLYHADYVGSGGNCGSDKNGLGNTILKWKCVDIVAVATASVPSYSIAIDPQGYSVIAYNNAESDFSPINLFVTYPNARVGDASPGWKVQQIDSAPSTLIATGALADLSFNNAGLGFIAYLQEEDYELPDLRITLQQNRTFLPFVKR
jgi:hypothetical protein